MTGSVLDSSALSSVSSSGLSSSTVDVYKRQLYMLFLLITGLCLRTIIFIFTIIHLNIPDIPIIFTLIIHRFLIIITIYNFIYCSLKYPVPVSYTHLDVYKRQAEDIAITETYKKYKSSFIGKNKSFVIKS